MRPKAAQIALFSSVFACIVHVNERAALAGEDENSHATDPITISEIEHSDLHFSYDTTGATFNPASGSGSRGAVAWVEHLRVETPLASRKYYFHLDYGTGSATSPEYGGAKILAGNLIAGGRAVWFHAEGIALGGDLQMALPTAQFGSLAANDAALVLATVRPWDYDAFRARSFTLMPAVDLRAVFGMFTFQFRHQVDVVADPTGNARSSLSTISTVFVGAHVSPLLVPGIEFSELYLIDDAIPDNHRSFFTITPSLRLNLGRMSPEMGVLTSLGETVHSSFDRVIAFHVSCIFSFGPEVVTP